MLLILLRFAGLWWMPPILIDRGTGMALIRAWHQGFNRAALPVLTGP